MEQRSFKRASVAFLCACVWMMMVLCFSMPARPAKKAHAVESFNDVITIYANAKYSSDGEKDEAVDFEWGTIFRGITILSRAQWEYDGYDGAHDGTISEITEFDDGYTIGNIDGQENLAYLVENGHGAHVHDFIYEAGQAALAEEERTSEPWDSIDENTHWAVCSDCGLRFQVAHRPGANGECKDCNCGSLDGDYTNTYSFTIPDTFPNDDYEWSTDENAVATIEIPFEATISAGFTLNLNLKCSGFMTNASGDKIFYEVAASADYGAHDENFDMDGTNAYPIWSYTPEDEDIGDDNRTNITDSTIYITLTLLWDEGEALYPGEYSDTLTFSAELIDDSEGY